MTETVVQEAAAAAPVKTPKKKATTPKAKSAGALKSAPTHPPTAQMVNSAVKNLKERGGSSLQAIKKYIAGTYKVDAEKLSPFIKKYLKSAVDGGKLIRTKGKGASGSFKLPAPEPKKAEKKPKVAKVKKAKAAPKAKKPKVEKPKADKSAAASPKKPKVTKPKVKTEKPKAAPKKKSPSKVKKTTKVPAAKKPNSPKSKKAASKPKTTKATAKK